MGFVRAIQDILTGYRQRPFLCFAKIKDGMIEQQDTKTEKAERWLHACGRKDFSLLEQIKKYTYISSLHFIHPIEENPDQIIATYITERENKKRKAPKIRTPLKNTSFRMTACNLS